MLGRAAVLLLVGCVAGGSAAAAAGDAAELVSFAGAFEKLGIIGVLVVACFFGWKEIKRVRAAAHDLRNTLINCHIAREMWKTAFFSTGAKDDDPHVKAMLDREERLLKPAGT